MGEYHIVGNYKMNGEINVHGAKNAILPILAGTILVDSEVVIENSPKINDTLIALEMLRRLGSDLSFSKNTLKINNSTLISNAIDEELVSQMRSSIIFLGALIGRFKECQIGFPGGCELGARPIDLHLKGLKALGVYITEKHGVIYAKTKKLKGAKIILDFPSVGATENIMLAAVYAEGETIIYNAAREPEIVDLQNFLNCQGAKIRGAGTDKIVIEGVDKLYGKPYKIMSDRIVAGTYLVAGAITGGDIILKDVDLPSIKQISYKLEESGCIIKEYEEDNIISLKAPERLRAIEKLTTLPYPGFPTDMQSQMMTLMTVAEGTSILVETIFESRNKHINELVKLGAKITLSNDGMTSIIKGVDRLNGTVVYSKDLRGGAALVLAGLVATGNTVVKNSIFIDRGYEDIARDLSLLGCKIKKAEDY
ncbi:MAG: UDP-N-acetylglucosamine 1-carboxyvinyltransferase [Lachnospirales bacterium]